MSVKLKEGHVYKLSPTKDGIKKLILYSTYFYANRRGRRILGYTVKSSLSMHEDFVVLQRTKEGNTLVLTLGHKVGLIFSGHLSYVDFKEIEIPDE